MDTLSLPSNYQHLSPAGAEVRPLMSNPMGGIAHCTLPKGKTSKAVAHKTVSEFWHVISGKGEVWRHQDGNELIATLEAGITVDIPLGTEFQYRCIGDSDLVFLCFTMPEWPGPGEVTYPGKSAWKPSFVS